MRRFEKPNHVTFKNTCPPIFRLDNKVSVKLFDSLMLLRLHLQRYGWKDNEGDGHQLGKQPHFSILPKGLRVAKLVYKLLHRMVIAKGRGSAYFSSLTMK
jgi:hypothetical protein